MVVRELLVGSFRLVGGAVGFRRICIDDLAVLIEVDSEATINLVAADVVIPLRVIANRFVMLDSVLFDEGPPCNRPARFVAVDICPVEPLFEGDEDDLVVVFIVGEHHRFGVLKILLDNRRVRCELPIFPDGNELASVVDIVALIGEGFSDFVDD
ncbi:hypothetical protein DJ77_06160 [Halorubrum ezzemoulense]|nr:hypothetical protein DJ77_06160 [Halorubrum ezzemoulense]OYR78437.1 hypothetical protein DJ84_21000 [Halorubrum ezzemoulense]